MDRRRHRRNIVRTSQAHPHDGNYHTCPISKHAHRPGYITTARRLGDHVEFTEYAADSWGGEDHTAQATHVVYQLEH